jgi:DNA-binding response OmpR family regulator
LLITITAFDKMKILIVEDEPTLLESVAEYLRKEGYICETASNFNDACLKLALYQYDCVVVDITLPGGSGLDIIRMLKKDKIESGIIIISAKNSLDDKITGLEIGSDDYLTKPFYLSELNARIKSVVRRRNFAGNNIIRINGIQIDISACTAYINNTTLDLTKKEYELLLFFASNLNRVITKEAIAEHLWGDIINTADSYDFVYTHIKNLRKKISENCRKDYIKTVYAMGYKWETE